MELTILILFSSILLTTLFEAHGVTEDPMLNNSCSEHNPKGVCPLSTMKCIDGKCKERCSSKEKHGFCYDDGPPMKCINGTCKSRCSSLFNNGYCDDIYGHISTKKRCLKGVCREKCSIFDKLGFCEDEDKKCMDGKCRARCSETEKEGFCDGYFGEKCINGICTPKCTLLNREGFCEARDEKCIDGICRGKCSFYEWSGYCPDNNACVSGRCKEICSSHKKEGYCEYTLSEKRCVDGVCRGYCDFSEPEGFCYVEDMYCSSGICQVKSTYLSAQAIFGIVFINVLLLGLVVTIIWRHRKSSRPTVVVQRPFQQGIVNTAASSTSLNAQVGVQPPPPHPQPFNSNYVLPPPPPYSSVVLPTSVNPPQ